MVVFIVHDKGVMRFSRTMLVVSCSKFRSVVSEGINECSYQFNRLITFGLVLALGILVCSCDKNPAELELKYQYSLYAYLMNGKTINAENPVTIKKLYDPRKPLGEQSIGVEDAVVKFFSENEVNNIYTLVHTDGGDYVLAEGDSLKIEPETVYHVDIDINGNAIRAKTKTPPATVFENEIMGSEPFDAPFVKIDSLRVYPIKVSCPLGERRIVYAESYCLEDYENARFINPFFGNTHPQSQEDYENPVGGFPRRLVMVGIYRSLESIDSDYILVTGYDMMFYFYGYNRMSIYVIDENYYSYLYNTNSWESGGVVGAYGVFGSGEGFAFYVNIVE